MEPKTFQVGGSADVAVREGEHGDRDLLLSDGDGAELVPMARVTRDSAGQAGRATCGQVMGSRQRRQWAPWTPSRSSGRERPAMKLTVSKAAVQC
jgi:hypothetical protein